MSGEAKRARVFRSKKGFTLIEALVSVVLLSIGLVAGITTLNQMTKTEGQMREAERMRRLADMKLQELIATGDYQFTTSGDFTDQGEDRYEFSASLEPTGTENLDTVTVTVTHTDQKDDTGYDASQVVFVPPTATGGATP